MPKGIPETVAVTLVPINPRLNVDSEFEEFVKKKLKKQEVTEGKELMENAKSRSWLFF